MLYAVHSILTSNFFGKSAFGLMTLLKELKSTYPAQGNALRSFECTPGPSSKDPKSPLRIA